MATVFDDIRLPEFVEQGAKGGPSFSTSLFTTTSGVEQRATLWGQSRAKWDIGYGVQSLEDLSEVLDFFYSRFGRSHGFRFKDWTDFNATAEPIATGDGSTRTFLLIRTYDTYVRRITRPVTGTVLVYLDGSPADPTSYDINITGGWIRFHSGHAPGNGVVITADFQFDVPVRFDTDELDQTIYWTGAGEIQSIPVMEVRDLVHAAPTLTINNTASPLPDNTSTASDVPVATIQVDGDPFGDYLVAITGGTDAASFDISGTLSQLDGDGLTLNLKAGTSLNAVTKSTYNVTLTLTDAASGPSFAAAQAYVLTLTVAAGPPSVSLTNLDAGFSATQSTASPLRVADIVVTQHGTLGTNVLGLTGANAADFTITGSSLFLNAGVMYTAPQSFDVSVTVSNSSFASPPQGTASLVVTFGVTPGATVIDTPGAGTFTVPQYSQLEVEFWGGGGGGDGYSALGAPGGNTTCSTLTMSASGGQPAALTSSSGIAAAPVAVWNQEPGEGGSGLGGTTSTPGGVGGYGFNKYDPVLGSWVSGKGGDAPNGGDGGAAVTVDEPTPPNPIILTVLPVSAIGAANHVNGNDGAAPGAGGGGSASAVWAIVFESVGNYVWHLTASTRPGSASGGYTTKTYNRGDPGAPVPGDVIDFSVGAGGQGGQSQANGGNGANGRAKFTVS